MLGTRATREGGTCKRWVPPMSDRSPCQLLFPSPHNPQASSPESRPYAEHPGYLLPREVDEVGNKRRGAVFMLTREIQMIRVRLFRSLVSTPVVATAPACPSLRDFLFSQLNVLCTQICARVGLFNGLASRSVGRPKSGVWL